MFMRNPYKSNFNIQFSFIVHQYDADINFKMTIIQLWKIAIELLEYSIAENRFSESFFNGAKKKK